jgi:hypothetical protein
MLINGYPPVNTAPVLDFYNRKGLDISKLERANSQEFRYIKGAGEGFFLLTQSITSEFLTLAVDDRTTTLKVLDRLSLEHPNKTGTILYLYHTAELKYKLYTIKVERNYNVTIRKSLTLYGTPAVLCLPPELEAPKTLEEVIDDFLPSGYTLDYDGPEITSYDIAIDGLSVLDAIDHLCSIYGLVWTATATTVYIFDMDLEDSSSDIIPGFSDPIKDINHTQLNPNLAVVNVSFPVYDWARTTPTEYITVDDISAVPGQAVNVQDPYFPAVLNPVGSVRNNSALNTRAGLIADNLEAIASSINFIEYNYYNIRPLGQHPLSLSEIVGDIGAGPFTIYRTLAYPYIPVKQQVAQDRLANNWIGSIADGYYGPVPTFIVIPTIPIDGALPPGPQVVVNKYRWNYGEPEWRVRVEWSPFEGVWNALQQEYDCPPEEAPPPPEEPTEPVDPWYGPEGPPSLPFPD